MMKKELPFEKLMLYAEGRLDRAEMADIAVKLELDPVSQELVAGLKNVLAIEGLNGKQLLRDFKKMEKHFERKIYHHTNFSNHLIELNRQLRVAAAVFSLLICSAFMMGFASAHNNGKPVVKPLGPYEMVDGNKVAP